jgi:hypothetical protein
MTLASTDLITQLPVNPEKDFFLLLHIKVSLMKGLVKLWIKIAVGISTATKMSEDQGSENQRRDICVPQIREIMAGSMSDKLYVKLQVII